MHWKRTLAIVSAAQFLGILGFSFAIPFAAFFLQDLGVREPVKLRVWVSAFALATPITLAIFSPIWGHVADRYGRRMLLRANLAAVLVLALMSVVRTPQELIALRMLQGIFTGTVTAAQTMVSVAVPAGRMGWALGLLSSAVFSGSMAGSLVGGFFADAFGYRAAFLISSFFLLAAALLILFGTEEQALERPAPGAAAAMGIRSLRSSPAFPVLLLMVVMGAVITFDGPFAALLVQEIHGGPAGAARWTGLMQGIGCVAGLLAGPLVGRLADRLPAARIATLSSLGAALLMLPQALAHGFALLFAARFGAVFFAGGINPVFQILLTRVTPTEQRGAVFGWAATARSCGWAAAPLLSGVVAAGLGVRAVFAVSAVLYLLLIVCIRRIEPRLRPAVSPDAPRPEPPAPEAI